jgi:Flp pilus assembly protein TadB
MKRQARYGSVPAAPDSGQAARRLRHGPAITLTCECGERRELLYGERWQCEKCERTWNTNRIPVEQYAAVRRIQVRLRWVMIGLFMLAVSIVIFFIAIGKLLGGVLLVAICASAWRMYIWPRQKRRYLNAIDNLPRWEIDPD